MPSLNTQATTIPESFVPLASLQNALRYWWMIALTVIAGGLFGWFAFRANPAQYEALAQFPVSIDYTSTGPLTQYEEDTAFDVVGRILNSEYVLQQVIDQAGKENIPLSIPDLRSRSIIERRLNVWDVRVRNTDPKTAERIAVIWAERGSAVIQESYQHALKASSLQRYMASLEGCLAKVADSEPSYSLCDRVHFTEIQNDLQSAGAQLYQEKLASREMFDGLTLGQVNPPSVSSHPVTNGRNQYVLFGALLGLLVGIGFVELKLPALWLKRS